MPTAVFAFFIGFLLTSAAVVCGKSKEKQFNDVNTRDYLRNKQLNNINLFRYFCSIGITVRK